MIIIAYNEEKIILNKLENCRSLDYPADLLCLCVVSDGSTDGTAEILRNRDDIIFIEDDVALYIKASLLALFVGAAILIVSVAREKFFMHKTDPYKDVVR